MRSKDWVETAQVVEARYATGDGVHARGAVYAYTDRPTVQIRQADGSTVSWIADMCVPVEGEDSIRYLTAEPSAPKLPPVHLKRGTARRLGIRPPNPMLYHWRRRWVGPLPEPTEPEIYIPGYKAGPARYEFPVNGGLP